MIRNVALEAAGAEHMNVTHVPALMNDQPKHLCVIGIICGCCVGDVSCACKIVGTESCFKHGPVVEELKKRRHSHAHHEHPEHLVHCTATPRRRHHQQNDN
jgi:hypothetical protein